MKKTYINPTLAVTEITVNQMILAGSPEGFNNDVDDTNTINPEDMLSRRRSRSVWGDDEEFEEEQF